MPDEQQKAGLIRAYDQHAEERDKGGIQAWKVVERANFLSLLQQEDRHTLLEIGTGHGRDSLFFREQGCKVIGIDLSSAMVSLCQQKGVTACVMDMVELGFDFEGIWEDDFYTPKRFFSLHTDEVLKQTLGRVFEIVYFRSIEFDKDQRPFQSVILRKTASKQNAINS